MDNIKEINTASNNNKGIWAIIIVLIIALAGLGYLFYDQKSKNEKIIESLTLEKEELTDEYRDLLNDYDELETTNDSVNSQLSSEKERVATLITELKTTKAQNRTEIRKYKNELKTLRKIMKGFIHTIDSLNTINIELTAENKEIKKQYHSARKKNEQLAEKYEEAADKVELASIIRAVNIGVETYNHKGKITDRSKKVKRFGVKFTLDKNLVAPKGNKKLFIRITDPENHVLMTQKQEMFNYEGEEIAYSAYRELDYNGEATNATVYYEVMDESPLLAGTYHVDIFCDGKMIGGATAGIR